MIFPLTNHSHHDIDSANLALEHMVAILEKKQGLVEYDILVGQLRNDFDNSMMAVARYDVCIFDAVLLKFSNLMPSLTSSTLQSIEFLFQQIP